MFSWRFCSLHMVLLYLKKRYLFTHYCYQTLLKFIPVLRNAKDFCDLNYIILSIFQIFKAINLSRIPFQQHLTMMWCSFLTARKNADLIPCFLLGWIIIIGYAEIWSFVSMKFCMFKESLSRFVSVFHFDFLSVPLSYIFSVPDISSVSSTWVLVDWTQQFGCHFPPISLFLIFIPKMYEFCYQNYPLNINLTRILASLSRMGEKGKFSENCFKLRILF